MLKFIMKLALQMGRPDFSRMAQEISQTELEWWMAFDSVCPLDDPWRRTARQTVVLANMQGAKLTNDHEDQMVPGWTPYDVKQTPEQMAAVLKEMNIHGSNQ